MINHLKGIGNINQPSEEEEEEERGEMMRW